MDPMTRYDLAMSHQHDLRLEAQERRRAKEAGRGNKVSTALGRLLITLGKALARVPELPRPSAIRLRKVRD